MEWCFLDMVPTIPELVMDVEFTTCIRNYGHPSGAIHTGIMIRGRWDGRGIFIHSHTVIERKEKGFAANVRVQCVAS